MSEQGSPAAHAVTEAASTPDVAPASSTPAPDAPSTGQDAKSPDGSSPPEGAKQSETPKPTLADVVRQAAEETQEGSSPDPARPGERQRGPDGRFTTVQPPAKPEELSFHNHPRWQEVNRQKNQLEDQVKNLSPDAEQFRQINGFMVQHRLTPQEVGDGFILMAMMKNGDPRALQKLDEYRTRIAAAMGETIPQDIQAKIESGEISDSVGKQMAKDRAQMRGMEQQQAQREADDFNAREYQRMEQLANAQAGAVSAWDAEQRKLDPDFAKKENAIARYARALMQEHGYPPTSDAAVILIKAAYDQVNADFTAALPAKEPHARPPIAPSSTGAKPVPRTLAEAVAQAAAM